MTRWRSWRSQVSRKLSSSLPRSPELIAGLEFAAIISGLVPVGNHVAICPTQEKVGPQRKDDSFSAHFRFDTWPLGRCRQTEVQCASEYYRIGLAHQIAGHGMNHLCFEQESSRIRPVADRHVKVASILRKRFRLDSGERAWPSNAGNSCVTKLVARAGIDRLRVDRCLPLSTGPAWGPIIARQIAFIDDLKRLYRATDVGLGS